MIWIDKKLESELIEKKDFFEYLKVCGRQDFLDKIFQYLVDREFSNILNKLQSEFKLVFHPRVYKLLEKYIFEFEKSKEKKKY